MPMLDVYIPEQALPAQAEKRLLRELAEILIEHEGADPSDPVARSLAKVWLHRPAAMLHAGETPSAPHYKVIASVPKASSTTRAPRAPLRPSPTQSWPPKTGVMTKTPCGSGSLATRSPTASGAPADVWSGSPILRPQFCATPRKGAN